MKNPLVEINKQQVFLIGIILLALAVGIIISLYFFSANTLTEQRTGNGYPALEQPAVPSFSATGRIEPLGPNIFMQGTHVLIDTNSKDSIILRSDTINLSAYEGKIVEVSGDIERSVNNDKIIINVHEVRPVENELNQDSAGRVIGAVASGATGKLQLWVGDGVIETVASPTVVGMKYLLRLKSKTAMYLTAGASNPASFVGQIVRVKGYVRYIEGSPVVYTQNISFLRNVIKGIFTIQVAPESFKQAFLGPNKETGLRQYFGLIEQKIPFGKVYDDRPDTSPYDPQWHWHLNTNSATFVDVAMELCDGLPSGVELDISSWIRDVVVYCPWGGMVSGYQ